MFPHGPDGRKVGAAWPYAPPVRRRWAFGLIALVAVAVAVGTIVVAPWSGDDDGDEAQDARDEFSVRAGEICSEFYARAGGLQTELQELNVTARSDRRTRRRGVALVEEIQTLSRQFVRDLQALPKPGGSGRLQDAEQLVASVDRFVDLQAAALDDVRAEVLNPASNRLSPGEVRELQNDLNAELIEQRALIRRLDIPECRPPGG